MFGFKSSETIRSRVTLDEIEGLRITIPAVRNGFLIPFLSVWLVGWAGGEVFALGAIIAAGLGHPIPMKGPAGPVVPFLAFWLTGWTVAGVFVMDALVWFLRGRESIAIDPDGQTLVARRLGTLIPRRTRSYPLDQVRNLRFAPLVMQLFPTSLRESFEYQLQWMGTGGGSIAFDHPGGTGRFGSQLSETESRRLIKTIKDHYKILDEMDEPLPVERL